MLYPSCQFEGLLTLIVLSILAACEVALAIGNAPDPAAPLPVVDLGGEVTISEPTVWEAGHYRIAGHLILQPGGTLTVRDSTVEILNTYSRQYALRWEGGTLVTERVTLGGTRDAVGIGQSNLELIDGRWDATDSTPADRRPDPGIPAKPPGGHGRSICWLGRACEERPLVLLRMRRNWKDRGCREWEVLLCADSEGASFQASPFHLPRRR